MRVSCLYYPLVHKRSITKENTHTDRVTRTTRNNKNHRFQTLFSACVCACEIVLRYMYVCVLQVLNLRCVCDRFLDES